MKVWNISDVEIKQMYNSKIFIIPANTMVDLGDDLVAFLLSKPEIRGKGLVQVKDGDSKEARFKEGKLNIYKRASQIYRDYERHCEERGEINKTSMKPHKEILEAKRVMDEYEKWLADGEIVQEAIKDEKIGETKVYMCPICNKEFDVKVAYFGHMRSHEKGKDDTSGTSNKSTGKG
jgi:hypothetical protein